MNWLEFTQIVNTEDLEFENEILVYPNPTNGRIYLDGDLKKNQYVEIRVYNVIGQLVFKKNIEDVEVLNEELNLSELENGNYFIKIQLEDGEHITNKILKH